MSVQITITDPASTDPTELQAVLTYLSGLFNRRRTDRRESDVEPKEAAPAEKMFEAPPVDTVREAASRGAREAISFADIVPPPPVVSDMLPDQPSAAAAFGIPVPPPPASSSAPIADLLVPAPSAATGIELDKDGIPWDGRIHASTKTKTVEAVWKKKRGVEQAEVDRVTAELRTTMMAPASSAVEAPPAPPAPPVAVPTPPAPPVATGVTFAEFMGHVTGGVTSGRFTREAVAEACAKHGAANLPGLINRPDLIPAVARELGLMA